MAKSENIYAFIRMYRLLVTFSLLWSPVAGGCQFPSDWHGRWYQSGLGEVVIRDKIISRKGTCHEHHRDYYLVENREMNCFQCLLIMHRHRNLIQYKESYCLTGDSLNDICPQIRVEAILYTLVREPSLPVECPFHDAYMFSYNNNTGGFCREPFSYVHACASEAKFRFSYKHCPQAAYTYDQDLDFECLATWKDGSDMFMYGGFASPGIREKNDVYRCFTYQMLGTVVYLAMSADATCRGLRSPRDGPLVMEFTQDVYGWPTPSCDFPTWFTGTTWQDLSGRHLYVPGTIGNTISVSHRRHPHSSPHVRHAFRCVGVQPGQMTNNDFVTVSFSSQDCTSNYQCVKIVRRQANVLEVYNGEIVESESSLCTKEQFKESRKHVIYPRSLRGVACPYIGRYRIKSTSTSDCKHDILGGCSTPSQLDIVSSCVSKPVTRLQCLETWTEGTKRYLIARQLGDNSATANCFTFQDNVDSIEFSVDRRCNRGTPNVLEEDVYTLDATPGPCELPPVEKPRVTQPVERSQEPQQEKSEGYNVIPAEDDPNVSSDYEPDYGNKPEFFHNSASTRAAQTPNLTIFTLLLTFTVLLQIRIR